MIDWKRLLPLLLSGALLAGCAEPVGALGGGEPPFSDPDKLHIVASFYVMADFVEKVAGDRAEVYCMATGGDPHHWEPAPRDIAALEEADAFVMNGGGFEHWADSVLPTLQNEDLVVLVTGKDEWLDGAGDTHDHADNEDHAQHSHTGGDPHFWLDPELALVQIREIGEMLHNIDPGNAQAYAVNGAAAQAQCATLASDYGLHLENVSRREVVASHAAFGHLCRRYGLEQIAVQGLVPEGEPDPAQMAKVIALVESEGATTIFFEQQASPKIADTIAKETGAKTAVLETLEGLSAERQAAGEDYFSVMRANLAALVEALQ